MLAIPGFTIRTLIHESTRCLVYRGHRTKDGQPVVIKTTREVQPFPEDLLRYRREYETIRRLDDPGIPRPLTLERFGNRPVLITEDIGGTDLKTILETTSLTLEQLLNIAKKMAEVLERIHPVRLIHADIKPSNFILNRKTDRLQLIDFGSSLSMATDTGIGNVRQPTGTPSYMSPEQSGRMNRPIDWRTDLYSLGATFYELFTRRPPFDAMDALELVHAHIARMPEPPNRLDPEIPNVVSEIILKLMAKNPEARYQSAHGLTSDLAECIHRLESTGRVSRFTLARQDTSDRFEISRRLVGRENELDILDKGFARAAEGGKALAWIEGAGGSGKTALVLEAGKRFAARRAIFLRGQFASSGTKVPFEAIVRALRDLVMQLVGENERRLARWREKIQAALGGRGQVAVDLIPELASVIGPQPALVELEPAAEQRRISQVLVELISVFCEPVRPLVLFLDGMDLADSASLELIGAVMTDDDVGFVYLIGAYRRENVHEAHELSLFQSDLQKRTESVFHLAVGDLSAEDLNIIVAETLKTEPDRVVSLSRIIMEKTGGNPYFVAEFLSMLHVEGLVRFNATNRAWQWDSAAIATRTITDNVAGLLGRKLARLSSKEAYLLETAAALGRQFDMETLAVAANLSREETAGILRDIGEAGLIVPLGRACIESYWNSGMEGFEDHACCLEIKCDFRFTHEQLLQAAYRLIPEENRATFHNEIGIRLKRAYDLGAPENATEALYRIADQLNAAGSVAADDGDRVDRAGIYLEAGHRAKEAFLFSKALTYLMAGLDLMEESWWQAQYGLALGLHAETAETAYLCGAFEPMHRSIEKVCDHARSVLDRVSVVEVKIQYQIDRNRWADAVDTALAMVKELGIGLSLTPGKSGARLCLMLTRWNLAGKSVKSILSLPSMSDPKQKAVMGILMRASIPMATLYPDLYATVISRMVRMTIRHGLGKAGPTAFMGYGLILGARKDMDAGYRFGRIAQRLIEEKRDRFSTIAPRFAFHFAMAYWKTHLKNTLAPLLEIHQAAKEEGNAFYTAYSIAYYGVQALLSGRPLAEIEKTMARYDRVVAATSVDAGHRFMRMFRQAVANLTEEEDHPETLAGPFYNETEMVQVDTEADNKGRDLGLYSIKAFLCLVFNRTDLACDFTDRIHTLVESGPNLSAIIPSFTFWRAMAKFSESRKSPKDKRQTLIREARQDKKKLKRWADQSPVNYAHKLALVEAVEAWVNGGERHPAVMDRFDRAIALASENDYICDHALANESAAIFCMEKNRATLAGAYLKEARYAYLSWGALAKVRDLENRHRDIFAAKHGLQNTEADWSATLGTTSSSDSSGALDLASVLKSAQAITGEIVLNRLLSKLLHIMMENAGARKGFLVLADQGRLTVEAEAALEDRDPPVCKTVPLDECDRLSRSIVHTVARTLKPIVLEDAAGKGRFTRTPYVQKHVPKSILCMPLKTKDKLVGVLYLENNLATDVFTPNHLQVMNLLSAQAAAALDNARLYEQLADYSRSLEKIIASLDLAQEVQQSLLPKTIPRLDHVDIAGHSAYCDETGGDYYDFIPSEHRRLGIVVGDVSGHGVSSALLMASIRGFLRSRAAIGGSPAAIITDVNRLVSADTMETGQFMTLFYLAVSQDSPEISWVRAGHDPAMLYCPQTDTFTEMSGSGIALGIDGSFSYEEHRREMEAGQILLLTTDGIFEARNARGEMFGRQRIQTIVRENANSEAEGIRKAVMDDVAAFRGEAPQDDDVTLVVLKFN